MTLFAALSVGAKTYLQYNLFIFLLSAFTELLGTLHSYNYYAYFKKIVLVLTQLLMSIPIDHSK